MARANSWTNPDGLIVGYGARSTINAQDAVVHTVGRIKQAEVVIDISNYLEFAAGTLAPTTHLEIPAGAALRSCTVVTEDAWNTLTSIAIGLKDRVDGSLVGADDTLVTDTEGVLANLGAGDVIVGAGTQLQAGDTVTSEAATIAFTVTGTAPTTGRSRVLVEYLDPVTSQDAPDVIVGEI